MAVHVEGYRAPLLGLAREPDELTETPPPRSSWPVRLLHRFDPMLLALKDKSWLIEDEHYKRVWGAGGHNTPVLLAPAVLDG